MQVFIAVLNVFIPPLIYVDCAVNIYWANHLVVVVFFNQLTLSLFHNQEKIRVAFYVQKAALQFIDGKICNDLHNFVGD